MNLLRSRFKKFSRQGLGALGIFSLVTLSSKSLAPGDRARLIIWNVGQGQWATLIQGEICTHLDTGGEFAPWRAIRENCRQRSHHLAWSHWDYDHINFALQLRRMAEGCRLNEPLGETSPKKRKLISAWAKCPDRYGKGLESVFPRKQDKLPKSSNGKSHIFVAEDQILIQGDSSTKQEQIWASRLQSYKKIRVLLLGHHGSRTATSDHLLKNLPHLDIAIASSRRARYGHPHKVVIKKLQRRGVSTLSTESWGSIAVELL